MYTYTMEALNDVNDSRENRTMFEHLGRLLATNRMAWGIAQCNVIRKGLTYLESAFKRLMTCGSVLATVIARCMN